MPFDGLVMAAVRRELERELVGSRIQRVHQPDKLTLLIQLRVPGKSHQLLLSAHPQQARVHLTGGRFSNPPSPPLFCSVCRKHLEGGRVEALVQTGFERILQLVVAVRDEFGEAAQRILVAEIMGRHSNLVLLDPATGIILDAIKRYGHAVSRYREVLPGLPYVTPPREKADPLATAVEQFYERMVSLPLELPLWKALQQCFEGLSPLMAREVVHRAGLESSLPLEFCGERELAQVWTALRNLFEQAAAGRFMPSLIFAPDGTPTDFAAFPVEHRNSRPEPAGMNAAVDRVHRLRAREERVAALRQGLISAIGHAKKRVERRLDACHRAAADAARAEELKTLGEILTANLYRLRENADRVVLENFYTGEPVEIPLDPSLSPAHNAQAYFKRYHKLQKGAERARAEIRELESEAAYLEALETAVMLAETPEDLAEVRAELAAAAYLRDKPTRKPPAKIEPRPLEIQTADNFAVLIGRNNRQNDLVTFRHARPDDVWLHAREIPGAHVVIRTGGRTVPPELLERAAAWAAWFSKARHGKKVPVDHTLRQHVQKPRGARPGFVTYTNEKTLLVDPQPPGE